MEDIKHILNLQRDYFQSGKTCSLESRKQALLALQSAVQSREYEILQALYEDLGKGAAEGYMSEVGMVLTEISYMLRHIRSFAKEKRVKTPLVQFPAKSYVKPCPYGTVLIMSPWNYPFLLSMGPLADALAAGNTVILKLGADAAAARAVIAELVKETFPPGLVSVVTGGRRENSRLLEEQFDYIFFTGGKETGRIVLEKAARYLTPVTLELGGKSPCIVDKTANIPLAARRIVFGKFLNAGQTCVAPDYLLVHSSVREKLLSCLRKEIQRQFGKRPLENPLYGKIINEKHFHRLLGLMEGEQIAIGGKCQGSGRIEPTVLTGITLDSPVMQEEIFGPVLPLLEFETLEEAMETVRQYPSPLALYLFTKRKLVKKRITAELSFGGGCINDTVIHLATPHMGFGGVGESGMGAYHGKAGFDTFTHYKSLVDKGTWLDLPFRYSPYTEEKIRMIRRFMK